MSTMNDLVHSDPEILSGTPVFVGTRVPVSVLFDYVESDEGLEGFLDGFPTVSREQALATLERAKYLVIENACAH